VSAEKLVPLARTAPTILPVPGDVEQQPPAVLSPESGDGLALEHGLQIDETGDGVARGEDAGQAVGDRLAVRIHDDESAGRISGGLGQCLGGEERAVALQRCVGPAHGQSGLERGDGNCGLASHAFVETAQTEGLDLIEEVARKTHRGSERHQQECGE